MSGLSYSDLLQGVSSLEHSISRVRFGIGEFLGVAEKGDGKLRNSLEVLLASELFRPTFTFLLTSILGDLQHLVSTKEEESEEGDLRDFVISPEHYYENDIQEDALLDFELFEAEDMPKSTTPPVQNPNKNPFVAMYLRNECHNDRTENGCTKRPIRKTKSTPKIEDNLEIDNEFTPGDHDFEISVKDERSETEDSDDLEFKKSPKKRRKVQTTVVTCIECNIQFQNKTRLLFHQRDAHRRRRQKHHCFICEQPFESWVATLAHWKSHFGSDEIKFLCPNCPGKEFVDIKKHIDLAHSSVEFTPKSCPHCHRIYDSNRRYKVHLSACKVRRAQAGQEKNKLIKCEVCQKVFTSKTALMQHMNIHTGARPYKCSEPGCNQTFKHTGSRRSHFIQWHTKRDRFLCTQCPSTFSYLISLDKHMREIHGPPITILCSMCPVTFKNEHNLRRHVDRVHLNLRPYPCTWEGCETAFKDKTHLTYHVNNTHMKEPRKRRGINKPSNHLWKERKNRKKAMK